MATKTYKQDLVSDQILDAIPIEKQSEPILGTDAVFWSNSTISARWHVVKKVDIDKDLAAYYFAPEIFITSNTKTGVGAQLSYIYSMQNASYSISIANVIAQPITGTITGKDLVIGEWFPLIEYTDETIETNPDIVKIEIPQRGRIFSFSGNLNINYNVIAGLQASLQDLTINFDFINTLTTQTLENTIYNPIQVFPYNNAIDVSNENTFNFIFNGEVLKSYFIEIYTKDDGSLAYSSDVVYLQEDEWKYNNAIVEITVPDDLSTSLANGDNYIWHIIMSRYEQSDFLLSPKFESNFFFFQSLSSPEIYYTINDEEYTQGTVINISQRKLNGKGIYYQSESVPLKNYSVELKEISSGEVIYSKDRVFSSNITFNYDGLTEDGHYFLKITTTTQQNQIRIDTFTINSSYEVTPVPLSLNLVPQEDTNSVKIEWFGERSSTANTVNGTYEIDENGLNISNDTIAYSSFNEESIPNLERGFSSICIFYISENDGDIATFENNDVGINIFKESNVLKYNINNDDSKLIEIINTNDNNVQANDKVMIIINKVDNSCIVLGKII